MAMGFAGRDDMFDQISTLIAAVDDGVDLPALDWTRVLVMTEFVFASNVFGSGLDWSITTGLSDVESMDLLRNLQAKFGRAGVGRTAFAPSSHQEYQWQRSAATAVRKFRMGSINVDELETAIDRTIEQFGADLDDLRDLRSSLAERSGQSNDTRRNGALSDIEQVAEVVARRAGRNRMFWL